MGIVSNNNNMVWCVPRSYIIDLNGLESLHCSYNRNNERNLLTQNTHIHKQLFSSWYF